MNSMNKVGLSVLIMFGIARVSSAGQDYSKRSARELNEALVIAVESGDVDEAQKLVQAGADINTIITYIDSSYYDWDCEMNVTALIYAVTHHRPKMVKVLLLKAGQKELNEALDKAVRVGDLGIVEELIKRGAHINYVNQHKQTPLILAVEDGCLGIAEKLIKAGADINYVDEDKNTPLIIAVRHAEATQEFSPQAQARATSRWYERRKIIQTLLKAGANVSHVNKNGRTALMEAVIQHDLNTVQSLLQVPEMTTGSYFGFGTKPINYADNDGNTALILAITNVRCSYVDNQGYKICVTSQNIVDVLLKTPGIDLHHVNKNGDTAIELLKKLEKRVNG